MVNELLKKIEDATDEIFRGTPIWKCNEETYQKLSDLIRNKKVLGFEVEIDNGVETIELEKKK